MASKSPWSVKGISQEDRDQAKTAARRAGVPVGVWLSQQIRAAGEARDAAETDAAAEASEPGVDRASDTDGEAPRPSRGAEARGGPDSRFNFGPGQWSTATDAVDSGQISQPPPQPWPAARPPVIIAAPPPPPPPPRHNLVNAGPAVVAHQPAPAPAPPVSTHWGMPAMAHPMYMHNPQPPAPPEPTIDPEELKALEKRAEKLEERLGEMESRLVREIDGLGDRLDRIEGLEQRIDAIQTAAETTSSEPGYSTAPVERAVMRLSERLQRVEDMVLPDEPRRGIFSRLFRRR